MAPIKTTIPYEKKERRMIIEKYIRQAETNKSLDEGAFRTPPRQMNQAAVVTSNIRSTVIIKDGEESNGDDARARYKELMKVRNKS